MDRGWIESGEEERSHRRQDKQNCLFRDKRDMFIEGERGERGKGGKFKGVYKEDGIRGMKRRCRILFKQYSMMSLIFR